MFLEEFITKTANYVLFAACIFVLLGSIFLTFKTRLIQLRLFPSFWNLLRGMRAHGKENSHTISPHRALFTAMSTTLGISTIVAPVIAISIGGPGALFGFLLTAFFGSAATYTEVSLSIEHRKTLSTGAILGGPMTYLSHIFSRKAAKWYAICCFILMTAWSGAQANQLVAILDSPLLGNFRTPSIISASLITLLVVVTLMGGIKRIGSFSSKLVPVMFVLYLGSSLFIVFSNIDKLGGIFHEMIHSLCHSYSLATGAIVGGIVSSLRWGIFKGIQCCEAGVGTQAIPHSMAETSDPHTQAMLSMISTYTAGLVAFLSGCVALITHTWQDTTLPLGISMVAASFEQYFSFFGVIIVAISTLLFGFGTILGNSYNGSQCFDFLTEGKKRHYYLFFTACMIFLGAISDVKLVWSLVDFVLVFMVVPHMSALVWHGMKKSAVEERCPA